jgi:serine/threonine protein kinase
VKVDETFDGGFEDEPSRVGGGGNGMVYKAKLQTVDIYGVPNEMEDVVVKRVWMRGQAGSAVEAHKAALQEAEMTAMTERMVQDRDLIAHVHGVARGRLTNPDHTDLAAALSAPPGAECVGIVMRYEGGGSLRDLVDASKLEPSDPRHRPLPLVEMVRIACEVARALDQVHTCAGVLHGDVKPENIFLSHHVPPKVRLGDFGFADSLLQGATMGLSVSVAARGGVRGTYWYMAPEMLKHVLTRARLGNQAGPHATRFSDVYALAITLAVMLTKKQPYEEYAGTLDDNALFEGVTRERDPLRPSLPLDTPPELRALIEECWSADRRARPLPREIARRLRGMLHTLAPTPAPVPVTAPPPLTGSDPLEAMRAQLATLQARLDRAELLY